MLIEDALVATKLREEVERDVAALTQSLHVVLCSDETRPLGDFVYLWEVLRGSDASRFVVECLHRSSREVLARI